MTRFIYTNEEIGLSWWIDQSKHFFGILWDIARETHDIVHFVNFFNCYVSGERYFWEIIQVLFLKKKHTYWNHATVFWRGYILHWEIVFEKLKDSKSTTCLTFSSLCLFHVKKSWIHDCNIMFVSYITSVIQITTLIDIYLASIYHFTYKLVHAQESCLCSTCPLQFPWTKVPIGPLTEISNNTTKVTIIDWKFEINPQWLLLII